MTISDEQAATNRKKLEEKMARKARRRSRGTARESFTARLYFFWSRRPPTTATPRPNARFS